MSARGRALRPVGAWVALFGLCVVLDGVVGAAVAVLVGALLLARVPVRWLGVAGVVALAIVPIVVPGGGLPGTGEVSPTFVSRTLVPHHLTFAGLVLASCWAVLELVPRLGVRPGAGEGQVDPGGGGGAVGDPRARLVAGLLAVGAVAVGAVLAVQAVLQA